MAKNDLNQLCRRIEDGAIAKADCTDKTQLTNDFVGSKQKSTAIRSYPHYNTAEMSYEKTNLNEAAYPIK